MPARRNGGGLVPVQQRLTEQQLQDLVMALCRALGLYAYHTYNSRKCVPGFPDLVIIGERVLWRELKSWQPSRRPTSAQLRVLAGLSHAGQDVAVWRPADWFSGRIKAQLMAIRHRPPKRGDFRASSTAAQ